MTEQNLMASSKRLSSYNILHQRKRYNIEFAANKKMFYQKLEQTKKETRNTKPPSNTEIEEDWKLLLSTAVKHKRSRWIKIIIKRTDTAEPMVLYTILTEELSKILTQCKKH